MIPKDSKKPPFISREISWLYFNDRILQEASDKSVPLIERLKFLAIFSSNLDEFYRVRVATLNRLANVNSKVKEMLGFNPRKVLSDIKNIVIRQEKRFDYLYEQEIINELAQEKIFIINEQQLDEKKGAFVRDYFRKRVLPDLVPLMLDKPRGGRPFPELKDRRIYFLVKLIHKRMTRYALVEVPTKKISRFLVLPSSNDERYIILLDDIIRYCLDELFFIFEHDSIEAYTIQLTRDAELDIDANLSTKLVESLKKGLQTRQTGKPMRLLYDNQIALDMLNFLVRSMRISPTALIPANRYHNFRDFIGFPNVGHPDLENEKLPSLPVKGLDLQKSIFEQMRKKDYLVSLPYQSFDYIIHFLREAAIDPKVTEISMTLYRLAENSKVINALINAAKNGKKVNCLIELKARFDEEANIFWSDKLEEGGVLVHYGIVNYKVHSKICLVTRREKGGAMYYANLATGNFNEKTAKLYCDHSLFTTHKEITADLKKIFTALQQNTFVREETKQLVLSPLQLRKKISDLIDQEIKNAQAGKKAYMTLKMNSLSDDDIILKLYEANNAGVVIKLIVRGMCCLVPGVPGFSENISVISIIDRFLEHARIYIFCNDGKELMYLSSADMMTRNLDKRVEVTFPILDNSVHREIKALIDIQLKDNVKARVIDAENSNRYVKNRLRRKVRTQLSSYNYLQKLNK